ncbi:MAG: hypothetical protein NTV63_02820 [Candidatus Woesearchaeota archaeon]|nr:hypothetical protein [Candidatus Woesearchaeota archaeon]
METAEILLITHIPYIILGFYLALSARRLRKKAERILEKYME